MIRGVDNPSGFFGPVNARAQYNLLVIQEGDDGPANNNTLAADDSCSNDDVDAIGDYGEDMTPAYIAGGFLKNATSRLNQNLKSSNYSLNANDTYTMMGYVRTSLRRLVNPMSN